MKRTPLKRKARLKPSTKPLKRTRLRVKSRKQSRVDYANKPMHDAYRLRFPRCQFGCGADATDIHELAGGSFRQAFRASRWGILHLCRQCHRRLQGKPLAYQLAVKLVSDSAGFDLLAVNQHRKVSMKEIDAYMPAS